MFRDARRNVDFGELKMVRFLRIQRFEVAVALIFAVNVSFAEKNPQRIGDSELALPEKWQACSTNEQCVPIGFQCATTSVSKEFSESARELIITQGRDPRIFNCSGGNGKKLFLCKSTKCGAHFQP